MSLPNEGKDADTSFESEAQAQNAGIIETAADDLNADRQSF